MSFILDALRKSDQQRQRSATPTLMSAQAPAAQPKPFAWGWYALLAAVLMSAGILIGWLHQWQPEPVDAAVQSAVGGSLAANAQKFTPAPLPAVPETTAKPAQLQPPREPLATQTPPPPAVTPRDIAAQPALPAPQSQPVAAAPAGAKVATAAAPEQPLNPVPGDVPRESGVLALSDLPPALQQEIPKLAILAHSYSSKAKDRFVFINDRMWREEEYPYPGLKLEQITPDGMIFSYKGYRFRRGTNP